MGARQACASPPAQSAQALRETTPLRASTSERSEFRCVNGRKDGGPFGEQIISACPATEGDLCPRAICRREKEVPLHDRTRIGFLLCLSPRRLRLRVRSRTAPRLRARLVLPRREGAYPRAIWCGSSSLSPVIPAAAASRDPLTGSAGTGRRHQWLCLCTSPEKYR